MESLYYLIMLLGIVWLCAWSIVPERYRSQFWWPFDMHADADGAARDTGDGGGESTRGRARRGSAAMPAGPVAAASAADLQHALPEPRPAQSWRVR